jgi:death-on-curing protein
VGSTSEALTIDEIVEINRQQIEMFGGLFLPVDNLRNRNSLEYAVEAMDAVAFDQELYPTLQDKAALLACTIIEDHVFHDGSKRTALAACRVFLLLNGFDLALETGVVDQEAMNIAIEIADSLKTREQFAEWVFERMHPLETE